MKRLARFAAFAVAVGAIAPRSNAVALRIVGA